MKFKKSILSIKKFFKHVKFICSPSLMPKILIGYFNTLILKRDTLRSIELAVTYQCQASCHKCYAVNLFNKDRAYINVDQIEDIIKQAIRLGIIHVNITGGEPTLRSDLFDIIKACRPKEIMVSLVTNALTLTKDKVRRLKEAGLNTIQISLDSADRDTHDKLRGVKGCYDKVMSAASWAREFGINLCFSTVFSTEPLSDKNAMNKLLELAGREKAFLLICDSAAVGGWEEKEEKMMTLHERNTLLEKLMLHPVARHHNMYNFRARVGCPAGTEKIYINAYGDVTPCDLIHDTFGNVLEERLEKIWNRMRLHPLYAKKSYDCVRYLDEFKDRRKR